MIKVNLGSLLTNHIDYALAHFRYVETGGGSNFSQSHPQARQIGNRGEQIAFFGQFIENFWLSHNQPLVTVNSALIYFKSIFDTLKNFINFTFQIFFDSIGNLCFNCLLQTTFEVLFQSLGHLFFDLFLNDILYSIFYRTLNDLFQVIL